MTDRRTVTFERVACETNPAIPLIAETLNNGGVKLYDPARPDGPSITSVKSVQYLFLNTPVNHEITTTYNNGAGTTLERSKKASNPPFNPPDSEIKNFLAVTKDLGITCSSDWLPHVAVDLVYGLFAQPPIPRYPSHMVIPPNKLKEFAAAPQR